LPGACVRAWRHVNESQVGRRGLANKPFPLTQSLLLVSSILTSDALSSKGEKGTVSPPFPNNRERAELILTFFLARRIRSFIHPSLQPVVYKLPKSMQSTFARLTRFMSIRVGEWPISPRTPFRCGGTELPGKNAEGSGGCCGSSTFQVQCH
jgi:hypothetical protein